MTVNNQPITAWTFLINLHKVCHFQTKEGKKVGRASNSELKRWIQNKALKINSKDVKWDELIDFHVNSVTLFTKDNAITLM